MSQTQQPSAAPADGRGTKALRVTTRILRVGSEWVSGLAALVATLAVVSYIVDDIFGIAPEYAKVTGAELIILILALWGGSQLISSGTSGAADRIDPDARDGDVLFTVAEQVKQLAADVRLGADTDDVRIGIQTSKVLPAVEQLLGAMGDVLDEDSEDDEFADEAAAFYTAAVTVREAACHLGEKYEQTA